MSIKLEFCLVFTSNKVIFTRLDTTESKLLIKTGAKRRFEALWGDNRVETVLKTGAKITIFAFFTFFALLRLDSGVFAQKMSKNDVFSLFRCQI